MNYTLTKREKTLLYALLCIVLVVAGWFLLLEPALRENRDTKTSLLNKQSELLSAKALYKEYSDAPLRAEEEKKKYASLTEGINKVLSNEEMDKIITELVLRNNLIPKTLNIEPTASISMTKYSSAINSEKTEEKSEENIKEEGIMKSAKLSLSVSGTLDSVKTLSDELQTNKGLRLNSFNYIPSSGEDEQSIVLNFTIYMMEK